MWERWEETNNVLISSSFIAKSHKIVSQIEVLFKTSSTLLTFMVFSLHFKGNFKNKYFLWWKNMYLIFKILCHFLEFLTVLLKIPIKFNTFSVKMPCTVWFHLSEIISPIYLSAFSSTPLDIHTERYDQSGYPDCLWRLFWGNMNWVIFFPQSCFLLLPIIYM